MHEELEQACKAAGISEFTPVDTVCQMQEEGRAFLAIDYDEQYDYDDMLERVAGGEGLWMTCA